MRNVEITFRTVFTPTLSEAELRKALMTAVT
jgi:hypothetical protein